jgi:prevent-host-death family protein
MKTVNIQAAKTHLSRLVEEAVAGDDIILAKAGRPLVRLVPVQPDVSPRRPGAWKGKVRMARDFNAADERIIALFEGSAVDRP